VNGVACRGPVIVAARGELRIALAVDLDRVLRQRRQFLALIRVVWPEVRFHDHRWGIGGQSLLTSANPSSAASGTARLVLPAPGAPETNTT
jgi:hypothetical protein